MQMVIDGDGHVAEPITMWRDYVDPGLRDRINVKTDDRGNEVLMVGEFRMILHMADPGPRATGIQAGSVYSVGDTLNPNGLDRGVPRRRHYTEAHPGGFDPKERLKVHDVEGVDGAVLFPSMGLFFAGIPDPAVAIGACRAVNRWAADYCAAAPRELYSVATLSAQDPAAAAAELTRGVKEHRLVAGCLRPNPTSSGRTLGDPSLDVLWATAQDLDVPLCFHNALNTDVPQAGLDRARSFVLGHAIVHPFEQMLAFGSLLEGGVFDRFPRLRVGFMESNCGWLPFWLDRLDEHVERLGWMMAQPPKRKPSEIFREQCVIGCENEEPMLPYVQQRFGEDRVLWASDFPHFDAELPGLVGLRKRTDLTEAQRDGALWRAAASFYHLDHEAIARSKAERRRKN
ncbi:MAG TPA: amidohydrolase family protein [Candidatus Binataceae bacterium]|jgi:predicted TIM-barrel fold metal-dependent hydrolase|nr:amidohydrolase family protein [Candidatus Binataceae bacterium]